jgi:hypothetical protein
MAIPDSPAPVPQPPDAAARRSAAAAGGPGGAPGATAQTAAPGSAKVAADSAPYVTRPTRWTIFLRTFIPWQLWRFARINMKMISIIRRSHR